MRPQLVETVLKFAVLLFGLKHDHFGTLDDVAVGHTRERARVIRWRSVFPKHQCRKSDREMYGPVGIGDLGAPSQWDGPTCDKLSRHDVAGALACFQSRGL